VGRNDGIFDGFLVGIFDGAFVGDEGANVGISDGVLDVADGVFCPPPDDRRTR